MLSSLDIADITIAILILMSFVEVSSLRKPNLFEIVYFLKFLTVRQDVNVVSWLALFTSTLLFS